ncbi:crotonase/enoyl-CoA hydratase family protein [Agrococcus sp. ARC_14]|uniref:crotonase/enoyl-CoA hydratase family protein n=1 Tax=Agrococcus sp. ARC_14 TaxID=2919927 RepID=UPI001F0527F8|nr:crotonase/enoyl-CoA hydratase family protein [Agrococcus sp. ARC_14]
MPDNDAVTTPAQTPAQTPRVATERRGHILHIALDRVDKRNAADERMLQELALAYGELDRDPELRVGVVSARGDHFTGGLDLADIAPKLATGRLSLVPDGGLDPWGLQTPAVSKPVLLAVQGTCFTLGIELALASDIVVAAETTDFGQLEVARGIMPFGGATVRFPRLGWGDAMRWILTGERFGAAEALRIGLVQEVVPAGAELERAFALAEQIAAQAPLAVQATLAAARAALPETTDAVAGLLPAVQRLAATNDARRSAESYLTGKPVPFEGD